MRRHLKIRTNEWTNKNIADAFYLHHFGFLQWVRVRYNVKMNIVNERIKNIFILRETIEPSNLIQLHVINFKSTCHFIAKNSNASTIIERNMRWIQWAEARTETKHQMWNALRILFMWDQKNGLRFVRFVSTVNEFEEKGELKFVLYFGFEQKCTNRQKSISSFQHFSLCTCLYAFWFSHIAAATTLINKRCLFSILLVVVVVVFFLFAFFEVPFACLHRLLFQRTHTHTHVPLKTRMKWISISNVQKALMGNKEYGACNREWEKN